MAYTAIYANGSTFNMVKKFVIDSFNEIYDIDTSQLSPGSTTFDISSNKTYMLNNKKQWIQVQVGTGGSGDVQSDWNQNDSAAADYVKNRPFYTGDPKEDVLFNGSFVFTMIGMGPMGEKGVYNGVTDFSSEIGQMYQVSWDGAVYSCVGTEYNSLIALGNLSIMNFGSDTGEPFLMTCGTGTINIYTSSVGSSHTISISKTVVPVVKIDKKYLVQPDWNQNDSTEADYVKNRPFYTADPVETVLVKESTATFAENNGLYVVEFPSTFEATVGETYKVSWDGTVYECTCKNFDGELFMGNLSITGEGSDTGEPFIMFVYNGEGIAIVTADTSASHTFSISALVQEIVKIDPKYLPMPIPFKPVDKSYLTFSSPYIFTLKVNDATKHWDGILEYFASDKTWSTWDGTSALSAVYNDGEYVLYLRGTGNTVITGDSYDYRWVFTGSDISCIGNIESLLDYATVTYGEHPTMAKYCYEYMFSGCTSLTQAPALPAIMLSLYCYASMFRGCTALTHAPTLPATTLAGSCYRYMFYGCTALIQAPALPATTMANSCYSSMFYGCTALTQAPALPATKLATGCYSYMFQGCTSLTQAPALPATKLATDCYSIMFRDCTSLKLSSTQTGEYTVPYCIPISGTGTTATSALNNMFASTGGTFAGTPAINTTYYLSSGNMIVRETEIATLNGYVGSMIDVAIDEYADTAEYIIPSSTSGSTKKFRITVDDSGALTATEVT